MQNICLNLLRNCDVFVNIVVSLFLNVLKTVHLNFHCTIANDTNLTVIFARGSGVRRDCADVQVQV